MCYAGVVELPLPAVEPYEHVPYAMVLFADIDATGNVQQDSP